jgi:hypothetical protein
VAVAAALAAVLDNPKATTSKPAAAVRLVLVLEKLRASSSTRRCGLALVRVMAAKGGAWAAATRARSRATKTVVR